MPPSFESRSIKLQGWATMSAGRAFLGEAARRYVPRRVAMLMLSSSVLAALVLIAVSPSKQTVLFENPSIASDDPDSWTIQGILNDGIDGDSEADPFKLDDVRARQEASRKARLGLAQVGRQRTTLLLGGDDWLGAPLAVPEGVRDHGEQQIGEEAKYWNTHDGQIGMGGAPDAASVLESRTRSQIRAATQQAQTG